jgi:signal transduction histidine kinase
MKIKNRLSLQFTAIVATMLALIFSAIYWITETNRRQDFYARVKDRALTVAEIFLAQDNLSKEKFREVQKKYPLRLPEEIVRVYDSGNNSVFTRDTSRHWSDGVISQVRRDRYLEYKEGYRQDVGIYYIDNSGNFVVLASATDDYGYARQRELLLALLAIFVITMIILFMAGRLFAEIALRPIIHVNQQVKNIQASDLSQRVDEGNGKDEISELAINFNSLLQRLQEAFQIQSSFVTNASHELRTPVTSIIGEIEVTLRMRREIHEYQRSLQSILAEAEKLKEITDDLMELAQANFNMDLLVNAPFRVDELFWDIRQDWLKKYPGGKLEFNMGDLPEDEGRLILNGSRQLLEIALNNVLRNARKFSDQGVVTCELSVAEKNVLITVTDQGIGIPPEDIQHIFQPFYRGQNARNYSGYGIGLSLSRRIVVLHQGTILAESQLGKGSKFVITLPVRTA